MTTPLYDTDFHAWAQQQARALQDKDWAALDLGNLSEEVEDLARRQRDAADSYLEVIFKQALKWRYHPQGRPHRGRRWRLSINAGRRRLLKLLDENPSLRPLLDSRVARVYQTARAGAADETENPTGVR